MRSLGRLTVLVHPAQLLLRGIVLAGAVLAIGAAAVVAQVPTWLIGAVVVGGLWAAINPDALIGAGVSALIGWGWLGLPPDSVTSPWVLAAGAGVVVVHLGLLVAAQGPARMAPDLAQVRLWLLRGAGLWVALAAVWLAELALYDLPAPSMVLVAVLLLVLGATVGTASLVAAPSGSPAAVPARRRGGRRPRLSRRS